MNKKEIEEYIKSKSITQDTYVAPTVTSHVSNSVPAMVAVSQTVKPNTTTLKANNTIQPVEVKSNEIQTKNKTSEEDSNILNKIGNSSDSFKDTKSNLQMAENKYNEALSTYQKALSDEFKKNNVDFSINFPRYELYDSNNKTFPTLEEMMDKKSLTNLDVEKYNESYNNVQKERDELNNAYNNWKLANYENNLDEVSKEKTNLWDKTGGQITRALKDLVSPLTDGEDYVLYDEQGNKTYLPSRNDLKQQAVRESYGDNLIGKAAKLGGDILYGGTKVLGAAGLDLASGGVLGKTLYWTDMAQDNYKKVKNEGYSNEQAILNTIVSTGTEFLTERLLGGFAGKLTGGGTSEVQNIISNAVSKTVKNPNVANIIGSMGSEGLEEFMQEYIGALNDKITLDKDTDIEKLVEDSLYSALVGAGSGGLVTGVNIGGNFMLNKPNTIQNLENQSNIKQDFKDVKVANQQEKVAKNNQSVATETQPATQTTTQVNEQVQPSAEQVQSMSDTNQNANEVQTTVNDTNNIAEVKQDKVITLKNNKGQELKLKRDKNNQNVFEKEPPKSYGKSIIPKEVMENQIAKLKDGTKISNFYSNITEKSKFITQENMEKLSKEDLWRYSPINNIETMENAAKKIGNSQKSLEKAYGEFMSKDFKSAEDVAEGWIFLKRFQDAGNYEGMVQVVKKMKQSGTTGGQIVQAYNIMSRLTPEGMVKYAQSELMDAEKIYNKGNSKKMIDKYAKNFELTGDEVQFIVDQMKTIENMPDGREKNVELAKIQKMLQDKLPPQKGQALKGWMRLSMLFNPKTQIRNVGGNALIVPVNAAVDVFGSLADRTLSRFTGVRTLGAPSLQSAKDYGKGFVQGGKEAWQDYKMGIDTKDVDMNRFEIGKNSKVFNDENTDLKSVLNPFAKGLNKMDKILGLAMNGGDRIFYQGAFENSLKNQMRLNNVNTPTQSMIDIATQEALARTWNDSNDYTKFVIDLRNSLNKFSKKLTGTDAYGLGDVLIPFAKTPANLTKAIYDYSPLGLASSIFETKNIKNAIETGQITPQMQHEFAQNIGKGVAGTILYILGYSAAKAGITTGSKDDDKDVANFIQNTLGIQPYSIKIGNHSYTYDWAQPLAAPFAITADAYKNIQNKKSNNATKVFDTVMDAANTGFNVLLSQSFFSGIQEVLNNNEGVVNGVQEQVLSLPARAVPTFLKQVNDMIDRTKRVSYERNQPIKTAKQNAMAKIPGESNKLAANIDTLGNEIQKYGGDKNNITYFLKVFLSPANTSNAQTSDIASEIYKVYKETGDKNIMPKVAPYYITGTSEGTKDLTSQEREKYQKKSGKLVNEAMVDLLNNKDYKSLSYDEKAEVINGIVNYADAKAKEELTGKLSTYYSSANKKITEGMAISDYYLDKVLKKRK